MVTVIHFDKGG